MKDYRFIVQDGTANITSSPFKAGTPVCVTYVSNEGQASCKLPNNEHHSIPVVMLSKSPEAEAVWKMATAAYVSEVIDSLQTVAGAISQLRWLYEPTGNGDDLNADVGENIYRVGCYQIGRYVQLLQEQARLVLELPIWYENYSYELRGASTQYGYRVNSDLIPPHGSDWQMLLPGESATVWDNDGSQTLTNVGGEPVYGEPAVGRYKRLIPEPYQA